jgi:hypothetical protein
MPSSSRMLESQPHNRQRVRKTLTVGGLVVNKERPKHNFGPYDLTRVLVTLWTKDDPIFIPERYWLQFTFIPRACYWTRARIGAFFKGGLRHRIISSLGHLQKGYRLKDIDIVLRRTPDGPIDTVTERPGHTRSRSCHYWPPP